MIERNIENVLMVRVWIEMDWINDWILYKVGIHLYVEKISIKWIMDKHWNIKKNIDRMEYPNIIIYLRCQWLAEDILFQQYLEYMQINTVIIKI